MAAPNIGLVHPECAPKPGAYTGQPREKFIGTFVKVGFPIEGRKNQRELLWLQVTSLRKDNELVGVIANEPVLIKSFSIGHRLSFTVDEILDVLRQVDAKAPPTEEEIQGAKMIIALQASGGVDEPMENAQLGWRSLSDVERKQTTEAFKALQSLSRL